MKAANLRRTGVLVLVVSIGVVALTVATNYDGLGKFLVNLGKHNVSDEIVAEAKRSVPEPKFPPKPAAKTQMTMESVPKKIKLPCAGLLGAFKQCTIITHIQVPKVKVINPTKGAEIAYSKEVEKRQNEYKEQLNQKIDEIEEAHAKQRREAIKDWMSIIGSAITAAGSVATIFIAVRKERREAS